MKIGNLKWSIVSIHLLLLIIGCHTFSNIQNIRQINSVTEINEIKEISLMTFNIRVGAGVKNLLRPPHQVTSSKDALGKIRDTIRYVNPDFVALQEVKGYSQAYQIAKQLNMNFSYTSHGGSDWWGLTVLSKYKITDVQTSQIRYTAHDPRAALICKIDVNGKPLTLVNVHYHLGDYESQIRATLKSISKLNDPLILLGDINRLRSDAEMGIIKKKFINTCDSVETDASKAVIKRGTITLGGSKKLIDHIFVDPKYFKVKNVGIVPYVDPKTFQALNKNFIPGTPFYNPFKKVTVNGEVVVPWDLRTASDHLAYFATVVFLQLVSKVHSLN